MTGKPLAAFLVVFFLTGSMAGCLGSGGLDVLPEKKGIPGGLTLALSLIHI